MLPFHCIAFLPVLCVSPGYSEYDRSYTNSKSSIDPKRTEYKVLMALQLMQASGGETASRNVGLPSLSSCETVEWGSRPPIPCIFYWGHRSHTWYKIHTLSGVKCTFHWGDPFNCWQRLLFGYSSRKNLLEISALINIEGWLRGLCTQRKTPTFVPSDESVEQNKLLFTKWNKKDYESEKLTQISDIVFSSSSFIHELLRKQLIQVIFSEKSTSHTQI